MSLLVDNVYFIGLGYAISSSLLVVMNKFALVKWPYPSTLTFLQMTFSWVFARILAALNIVDCDALDVDKVRSFAPACLIFYIVIACNLQLLEKANVDTFIVMRSLVPLFTAFAERLFIGTTLPNLRVFGTLVMIVFGAVGFVAVDKDLDIRAYGWGFAYIFTMVIDTILVKKVVTKVELKPWGLVFYNNLIASCMFPFFAFATGELSSFEASFETLTAPENSRSLLVVVVSCLFGLSISFFGLNARKKLQATAYSVLGVVCKFATVLVNTIIWDNHASAMGIVFLCVCITGGILYQQEMKSSVLTNNVSKEHTELSQNEDVETPAPEVEITKS